MNRKTILLGLFGAFLFSSLGYAEPITIATTEAIEQVETVYVAEPPPAAKAETKPPTPGPKAVWIGGHWKWQVNKYVWIAGHWTKSPQGSWVPGHWQKRPRGYVWVAGHWTKISPSLHKNWVKGHWVRHKGTRVWVAGHWKP